MFYLLIILLSLSLEGCNYFSSYQKLDLKLIASSQLNPDINNRPSPLLISLYELKSNIPFKNLAFANLGSQAYKNLKSSLVDVSEIEIRPSETKNWLKRIKRSSNYIGIVAAYRDLEQSKWRQVIAIPKNSYLLHLKVMFEAKRINYRFES